MGVCDAFVSRIVRDATDWEDGIDVDIVIDEIVEDI